jgi:hypothetical protein
MADNDISYLQPLAAVVLWCCGAVVPWVSPTVIEISLFEAEKAASAH